MNPKQYLSKLDSSKVPNGILIDRAGNFKPHLLKLNGQNKVTTCDFTLWFQAYDALKYAAYDTANFLDKK